MRRVPGTSARPSSVTEFLDFGVVSAAGPGTVPLLVHARARIHLHGLRIVYIDDIVESWPESASAETLIVPVRHILVQENREAVPSFQRLFDCVLLVL